MSLRLLTPLACALAVLVGKAAAAEPDEITLFSEPDFAGQSFTTRDDIADVMAAAQFEPKSAKVIGHWDVCGEPEFTNPCTVLRKPTPNFDYVPAKVGTATFRVRSLFATYRGVDPSGASGPPMLELYERPEYMGAKTALSEAAAELPAGPQAASAHANGRWRVCDGPNFTGACKLLEGDHIDLRTEPPFVVRSARQEP